MKSIRILSLLLMILLASCSGKKVSAETIQPKGGQSPDSGKITFIELGSVDCVPCQMMQPVMEQMRNELGDQVDVIFYDVWTEEGQPYGQQYGIRVIPTQVFLDRDGKEYYRHEGYFPVDQLYPILEQGGVTLP